MSDELYCYPGSNVQKNKMEIRDMEQLHEMERKLPVRFRDNIRVSVIV